MTLHLWIPFTEQRPSQVIQFECASVAGNGDAIGSHEDDSKITLYTLASKEMRADWGARVEGIYNGTLKKREKDERDIDPSSAVHFCWWTRYGRKLQSEKKSGRRGTKGSTSTETENAWFVTESNGRDDAQRLVRMSKETIHHASEYVSISESMVTFFPFVSALVSFVLTSSHPHFDAHSR